MQSWVFCCYLIILGSWSHFYLLKNSLRCLWYAKSRGQRLLHWGVLKVTSSPFWTCCNLCRDGINALCFLRCYSFVHHEFDITARGDHSKICLDPSFQSRERPQSKRPSFHHHLHLSNVEDPLIGQSNCFLPCFNEVNTHAVLRNMVW